MKTLLKYLEIPALIAVPVVLIICALLKFSHTAILSLIVVLAALIIFFAHFETSKPSLRQIMPAVVLGGLAAAGRILFVAIPNVKPVTAICIVSGAMFGRHVGFLTGAIAALISNFFFGQGPWTPWQMYAWGMTGYFAGIFFSKRFAKDYPISSLANSFKRQLPLYLYGAFASFAYGILLNTWMIVGFIQPLTWEAALLAYAAGIPFDITHAISTVIFLGFIMVPWQKKLTRIKEKYAIT